MTIKLYWRWKIGGQTAIMWREDDPSKNLELNHIQLGFLMDKLERLGFQVLQTNQT